MVALNADDVTLHRADNQVGGEPHLDLMAVVNAIAAPRSQMFAVVLADAVRSFAKLELSSLFKV